MLHILLVPVNDLISHPITTRFYFLAKSLTEKHRVHISLLRYTKFPSRADKAIERSLGIENIFFRSLTAKNVGSYYLFNSLGMGRAIMKCLKKQNVDAIIHANVLPSTLAAGVGKAFNVPLIFDYQDHFPESAAAYFKDTTKRTMVYSLTSALTRLNIGLSDLVVTVTDYHRAMIRRYDSTKPIHVIPNGVDPNLFRPIPKLEALKKLGMEDLSKKTIILFFGSVDPWVDFATPIQVIKRLVKRGFDILFLIVGFSHTGYYVEEIRNLAKAADIEDNVRFFGPVPQDELVYFINAADVVLVPYKLLNKNQAVPLKVLESLACGKEVIVSRIAEIVERFGDVVFSYASAQELELGILQALRSGDKMAEARRQEALQTIIHNYSWDSLASKYYRLIELLVSDPNKLGSSELRYEGSLYR